MAPAELLTTLIEAGCRLMPDGDVLRVRPPRQGLTDELRQAIHQHKAALLALLTQPTPANDAATAMPSPEACPHPEHFPPTLTDGTTRQCRHCPHVWQVPCGCGSASWKPTAHWGADGAGTVLWTCEGCGSRDG